MPVRRRRAPRSWSDTPTIWSPSATPGRRRTRSRRGSPHWLAPRGLAFNEDKTRVVTLDEGFDFLGFNVRRYHGKLLIKPSKAAIRADPGTAAHRTAVPARGQRAGGASHGSTRSSGAGPPTTGRWCPARCSPRWITTCGSSPTSGPSISHPNKPTRWIVRRYFGTFNKSRHDRWVFGDRASGAYLHRFAWTKIVRHQMVKGTASPDDPALTEYWAGRRRKAHPCRSTRPPCGSSRPSTAAARSAGARSCTPTTRHKARVSGNNGWRTTRKAIITIAMPADRHVGRG